MIVVTVELHSAITGIKTVLGRAVIHNVGTFDEGKRADYAVKVGNKNDAEDLMRVYHHPQRTGSVKNYPRMSYNVWRLVIRALRSAFPEER